MASTAQCDMFFKMINTRSFYSKFRGAVRAATRFASLAEK